MADKLPWKEELRFRIISWLVWAAVTVVARSVRLQVVNDAQVLARWKAGQPSLISAWHGRTLIPVWEMGPRHWSAMVSLSNDGEYQNRIFSRFGWDVVRGSTGRGGARALVAAMRRLKAGGLFAVTPDGPRGPSHRVHPGILFMAQKSGAPIFPLATSSYPRWFLSTWDRYQIPRPFARSVMLYGEPLVVPPDASEEDLNAIAAELARRMCDLEMEAEGMVAPEGKRQPCEPAAADDLSADDSIDSSAQVEPQ